MTIYADLRTYRGWKNVPKNLKTRTALKKKGLYVPHGVPAAAQVISQAAFGREGGCYLLFNTKLCRPLQELLDKETLKHQIMMRWRESEEKGQAEKAAAFAEVLELL